MFDIFCHKITFVFQDTQVEVNDLLDFLVPKEAPHKVTQEQIKDIGVVSTKPSKKQLIDRLNNIFQERQAKRDRMSKKAADAENSILSEKHQRSSGKNGRTEKKG
jgi:hypothetical protein